MTRIHEGDLKAPGDLEELLTPTSDTNKRHDSRHQKLQDNKILGVLEQAEATRGHSL